MKTLKRQNLTRILCKLRAVGCGFGLSFAFSIPSYVTVICEGPSVLITVVSSKAHSSSAPVRHPKTNGSNACGQWRCRKLSNEEFFESGNCRGSEFRA